MAAKDFGNGVLLLGQYGVWGPLTMQLMNYLVESVRQTENIK